MKVFELIRTKRDEIIDLGRSHGITNLRVFGSVVRGQEQPHSDIDFLATISPQTTLFDLMSTEIGLENLLSHRVEISADDTLASPVLQNALREARPI